jgi:predicted DNA-binding protein (UPF0251 family)
MSLEEMAIEMGISTSRAQQLVNNALKKVEKRLKEYYDDAIRLEDILPYRREVVEYD